jgi:23S rRNA (cytidine2498-2'-O)-methyltransferase
MSLSGNFIFCLTQVGSEKWLKKEIAQTAPHLKFAFSRPGFLTFKSDTPIKHAPHFTFSRITARSFGKFKSDQMDLFKLQIDELLLKFDPAKLKIHLFVRDCIGSEEDPKNDPSVLWLKNWQTKIQSLIDLPLNVPASHQDPVLHIVIVEENEIWIGQSVKRTWDWGLPGGRLTTGLPELAPSRAYLKIEEAITLSGVRLEKSDRAIEIGSAPGGACYALLERGLTVSGIDRGEMAPIVQKYARFKWFASSIRDFSIAYEDPQAEWVLVDMNTEPRVSVKESLPLLEHTLPSLCGIFFTMKVNHEAILDDLPVLAESLVRKLRLKKVQMTQLPSNRSEVCFMGVTELGLSRLPTLSSMT